MMAALIRFVGEIVRGALVIAASIGAGLLVAIWTADSFGLEPLVWLLLSCASGVFVAVVIFRSEHSYCRDVGSPEEVLVVHHLDDKSETNNEEPKSPVTP